MRTRSTSRSLPIYSVVNPRWPRGRFSPGCRLLYGLFKQAPTLGSLIEPDRVGGDFFTADFATLRDGLTRVLRREAEADQRDESTVAAAGMALAADILAGEYTLVATNVPFLGAQEAGSGAEEVRRDAPQGRQGRHRERLRVAGLRVAGGRRDAGGRDAAELALPEERTGSCASGC